MIVIGSFTSANSKRLTQLSLERNGNSYQVMDENDIDESWFSNIESVGISAGASTPDNIIERVINKVKTISRINKKEEIYE
jgi:4-hydroxy-3-methylbut-2-enyl diphosphate reductase